MDSGAERIVESFDEATSLYEFRIEVAQPPNHLWWGAIVGDIAHNLRSALDQLVWQLVLLTGRQAPGSKHQFPIALREVDYLGPAGTQRGMRNRMLAGIDDEHLAVIDRVQPFRMGDSAEAHSLAHLQWLSNVDKHRVIHTALFETRVPEPDDFIVETTDDDIPPFEILVEIFGGPLALPATLATVGVPGAHSRPHVGVRGQIAVDFGFGEAAGRSLNARSLRELWVRVGSLVFEFRDAFGKEGQMPPRHDEATEQS